MIGSKFTLVVAVAALALVAADTTVAFAKGKGRAKRRNVETVRLAPPADGASVDGARGNVTITHGRRGDDAVLHVKGLERRSKYDVVDGQSGERLGTLRTNRRGAGTFDLTPRVGKRVLRSGSASGENAGDVPDIVEVVDPDTGDTVLTGDTTGDLQALYGYATLGNATESATVTMGSDPISDTQYFSFSYFAEPTGDRWIAGVYEFYADTVNGGSLPLGKASVLDLAGLRFQVRNDAGDAVFKGTLPDVEAYAIEDPKFPDPTGPNFPMPMPEDPVVIWEDGSTRDPNAGQMPFDFSNWFAGGDPFSMFAMDGMFGGGRNSKSGRLDPVTNDPPVEEPPAVVFTLWLETAEGYSKAGELVAPDYGFEHPCPDWDDFDWGGEWGEDSSDEWTYAWNWDWTGEWTWHEDPATGSDGTNTAPATRRR